MTIWIAGGALTALTTLTLLVPSLRGGRRALFSGRAQAVYADQLSEVARDEAAGLILGSDADAARVEIKHRMLTAAQRGGEVAADTGGGKWLIIAAVLLVPALGLTTYASLGRPDMPSQIFANRGDERQQTQEFEAMVAQLRQRLSDGTETRPGAWITLAQTYQSLGRPQDAVWALEGLIAQGEATEDPGVLGFYAEALIQSDDGIVSPKAEAVLDRLLALDPASVAGVFYKARALEQSGDIRPAFDMLRDRIGQETAFRPWMETLVPNANRLAASLGESPVGAPQPDTSGPTAADVAAAGDMSTEDRQAFIRSMVERLAARMQDEPDNLDGWLKLGNAYQVLGDTDKALYAYHQAGRLAEALPASDPRRATIEAALGSLGQ